MWRWARTSFSNSICSIGILANGASVSTRLMCENMANRVAIKICRKCKVAKPNDNEHYANKKSCKWGLNTVCKECHKVYKHQYYQLNLEPTKIRARERMEKIRKERPEAYKKYKEGKKRRQMKRNYGLTEVEYMKLFEIQNYECGICSTKITPFTNMAHVDHVHVDGYRTLAPDEKKKYVRGILCHTCNRAIGMLGDDVDGVLSAARYLLCWDSPHSRDISP